MRVRGHVVADGEERRATWAGGDEAEQCVGVVDGGAIQHSRDRLGEGPRGADDQCARDSRPQRGEALGSRGGGLDLHPRSESVASHGGRIQMEALLPG